MISPRTGRKEEPATLKRPKKGVGATEERIHLKLVDRQRRGQELERMRAYAS